MPKCYFCNREVNYDNYCVGCHEYVCDECDRNEETGEHEVEDHKS